MTTAKPEEKPKPREMKSFHRGEGADEADLRRELAYEGLFRGRDDQAYRRPHETVPKLEGGWRTLDVDDDAVERANAQEGNAYEGSLNDRIEILKRHIDAKKKATEAELDRRIQEKFSSGDAKGPVQKSLEKSLPQAEEDEDDGSDVNDERNNKWEEWKEAIRKKGTYL